MPPFDPEHWGLTISSAGENFDAKSISSYAEEKEEGVIAQLVRVRESRHERQRFTLDRPTSVRIYAIGEGARP